MIRRADLPRWATTDEVYEDLAGVAREAVALVPPIGGAGRVVELSRGRS